MLGSFREYVDTTFDIPGEIYQETLYYLPLATVLNMCEVNKHSYQVCHSDKFWKEYTVRNYPKYIEKYNHYLSVKELGDAKWVDVQDESSGFKFPLKLNKDITLRQFEDKVREIAYDEHPTQKRPGTSYFVKVNDMYQISYISLIESIAELIHKDYRSPWLWGTTKIEILIKAEEFYEALVSIIIKKDEKNVLKFIFDMEMSDSY
jgi:hypothetical protein